ncbi:MAG: twin-arginine translocation signal domain-containing protein, partial [Desulfobacula sp.]|nr:twin-arginine translocation signal domain-containing protein [Desulfobacula sp.]
MTEKLNDTQISRRKFLRTTTLALTGGAVAYGGVSVMAF